VVADLVYFCVGEWVYIMATWRGFLCV